MNGKDQSMKRTVLIGAAVLVIVAAAFAFRNFSTQGASAKAPMSAIVSLSVDKESFDGSDDVLVHVTITNPNNYPIRILKWFTPLNGIERSLFTVTRNGESVRYIGRQIKRAEPTEADYITLEAGGSVTADVNLSEHYELSSSDNYEVMYDVTSLQLYVEKEIGELNNGRLSSTPIKMFITGREAPAH
ncbi:MAG: hypothetical protein IPO36_15685 [Anaerolineales bacterium]|uniref:hypothetical protein n=1 Tax=Candidatus Villigracilis affinis TaxID=3140682 RepID=UPI002A1E821C|nr:hypothetical protein [Anaerolineales bacterium]MBL0346415.1 hypothetical protein [Anaerolineales bacterium]